LTHFALGTPPKIALLCAIGRGNQRRAIRRVSRGVISVARLSCMVLRNR